MTVLGGSKVRLGAAAMVVAAFSTSTATALQLTSAPAAPIPSPTFDPVATTAAPSVAAPSGTPDGPDPQTVDGHAISSLALAPALDRTTQAAPTVDGRAISALAPTLSPTAQSVAEARQRQAQVLLDAARSLDATPSPVTVAQAQQIARLHEPRMSRSMRADIRRACRAKMVDGPICSFG